MYKRVETGELSLYVERGELRPEMRGGFMSDAAYLEVLDNTIIVCTDTIIVNHRRRTVYLAKRATKPMKGLWWIGGRRNKAEAPLEGIRRNFKRETGLDLPGRRFKFVTITEYIWTDREQSPQEKGSHNLCHQFAVELNDSELATARQGLEKREYDREFGLKEFDRAALVAAGVHPVILEVYDLIFPAV